MIIIKNRKFIKYIILSLLIFFVISPVKAFTEDGKNQFYYTTSETCTKESVIQLALIIANENGSVHTDTLEEDMFCKLSIGSVVLNNSTRTDGKTKGSTVRDRIYYLADTAYAKHSSYRNKGIDSISDKYRDKIIYISELILSGRFALPQNMRLQAAPSIVTKYGNVWAKVKVNTSTKYTYFGYAKNQSLSNVDIFERGIVDTSSDSYRELAKTFVQDDYSGISLDNVCTEILDPRTVFSNGKYVLPDKYKETYTKPVYTQNVYTEPVYTEPVYTEPVYTEPTYTSNVYTETTYTESNFINYYTDKTYVEDIGETINTKKIFLIVEILFIIFDIGYILYVHFNKKESVYKLLIVSVLFIIIIELLKYLLF